MKIFSLIKVLFAFTLITGCTNPSQTPQIQQGVHIHDIQGCGHYSPFTGKNVDRISGIVTARADNGFYLQDPDPDELDCTSEALFVFTKGYPDVRPGDKVEIFGIVEEYIPGELSRQNLPITEIRLNTLRKISQNNDLPKPFEIGSTDRTIPNKVIDDDGLTKFQPESDGIDYFESLESMLVSVKSGTVVGAKNDFNEVVVVGGVDQAATLFSKEGALLLQPDDNNPERIILNLSSINTTHVNVGEELTYPVMGILDYSYGNYKINTFGEVDFSKGTPSDVAPLNQALGTVSIASLNLKNLAPDNNKERFREIADVVCKELDSPDILVVHEIMDDSGVEDDGTVSAEVTIGKLIQAIKSQGGVSYDYLQADPENNQDGGVPGGNIRSVVLFRHDRQISRSSSRILNRNPTRIGKELEDFTSTRKPLVVNLRIGDREVVIIAAHLTSRGADSPLFGAVQPIKEPEKLKRELQAKAINQFAQDLVEKYPDTLVWIVGDMNDYYWSQTLANLRGEGVFTDLGDLLQPQERYTYILDGNAFQFDYILVSNQIPIYFYRFSIPHLNTLLDSTLQVSDHDPVWMEFTLP